MAAKKTEPKNITEMGGFAQLVEKRKEELGGDGKSFTITDFGRDWHIAIPDLQSAGWNDDLAALRVDVQEGYISQDAFRDEYLDMFLGDQADDFAEAVIEHLDMDPLSVLTMALNKQAKDAAKNPTQRGSRSIRRNRNRR